MFQEASADLKVEFDNAIIDYDKKTEAGNVFRFDHTVILSEESDNVEDVVDVVKALEAERKLTPEEYREIKIIAAIAFCRNVEFDVEETVHSGGERFDGEA
jgi:hypothetical protein